MRGALAFLQPLVSGPTLLLQHGPFAHIAR
jgi:hypothetical protein